MPRPVPTPVAAALGLVPAVLGGVRRLPGKAVQLPVLAVSSALTALDGVRREYGDLAERGEQLVARLRGSSVDGLEDRLEDVLQGTPLATPYDRVEDAVEQAAERARAAGRNAAFGARRGATETATETATDVRETSRVADELAAALDGEAVPTAGRPAGRRTGLPTDLAADLAAELVVEEAADERPEQEQPKGVPTPAATEPDATRIDTAATADVVRTVQQVSQAIPSAPVDHDDLPLPDYDHMTLGSLRGRLRSLDVDQLVALRGYEKAHADRLPVVTMLDNRIAKLATTAGSPSATGATGAPSQEPAPEQRAGVRGGSKVGGTSRRKGPTPPHGKVRTT